VGTVGRKPPEQIVERDLRAVLCAEAREPVGGRLRHRFAEESCGSRVSDRCGVGGHSATLTRVLRLAGMPIVSPEMVLVPDEELQQLAEEKGPASAEAQALAQLKTQRAQDLQVHCFRVGDSYVTGTMPETSEPARADELLDALKAIQKE
jgi:hypothetical protein